MKTLEEHLTAKIHPEVSSLWAVADGDGLYLNDSVTRLLAEKGAEVFLYDDPMAFRFRYEHEIRPKLESSTPGCHVIVVDPGNQGLRCLPADIYQSSRHIDVSLGDLFPKLARSILRELDPAGLGALWEKQSQFPVGVLGEQDTADLILRLTYRIEPTFINSLQDFVQVLVALHFEGRHLPDCLALRLMRIAAPVCGPLDELRDLIRNSGAFWNFMQTRWEGWIKKSPETRIQQSPGAHLDFNDPKLRVWMDNLFLEGVMKPARGKIENLPHPWCAVGVERASKEEEFSGLATTRARLLANAPSKDAGYKDWLLFAHRYSTHVAELFSRDIPREHIDAFWSELWEPINERFSRFLASKLESLANLPPTRPILANQIARFLGRRVASGANVALLVLDGLSLAQWIVLREELRNGIANFCANEEACFTIAPSLTNVARQCIYSGELPLFFEGSIERTDMDGKRWKNFWDGAHPKFVRSAHLNVEGKDADLETVREAIERNPEAMGITVRMPDEIVHGTKLGWRGVAENLRVWARQAFLKETIELILEKGFELYLVSDHGNLEAVGAGNFSQGVLAERSGQRVRIYSDSTIFDNTLSQLAGKSASGASRLLPTNYLPMIHSGRGAYVTTGQVVVAHGGRSLDEMIIPFVQLSKLKNEPSFR